MPLAGTSQRHWRKEDSPPAPDMDTGVWDERENVREAVGPQEWLQEKQVP